MIIELADVGKRYNRQWIFRHFNYTFQQGNSYAITGANGSGKSTLLQVIAGAVMQSEGYISYQNTDFPHTKISIATPYLELIEELTANEFLKFHSAFKPLKFSFSKVLEDVGLSASANKQIKYFSSGMKQRLKLAQAFLSESECLFLDEPTTNLDAQGIQLYRHLIENHHEGRTIIISSNDINEYSSCREIIKIENYK